MKDKRLEKEFGEYFKGVQTPEGITDGAKKYVKPKRTFLPKFIKYSAVTASCIAIAVSAVFFARGLQNRFPAGDSSPAPPPQYEIFGDGDLSSVKTDAYSLPDSENLKIIKKFALMPNAQVENCSAGYLGGELALFTAQINFIYNLRRYEAQVFIEFDSSVLYSPLEEYLTGEKNVYRGMEYRITQTTAQNGEPEYRLCTVRGNARYCMDIISSAPDAYIAFLEIISNNF